MNLLEAIGLAVIVLMAGITHTCHGADLPDNALPLAMLESRNASEMEVRKTLGEPIQSVCTVKQEWQSWLDYSDPSRPCVVVARFLAGVLVMVSPEEIILAQLKDYGQ